jgi:hypothetical protein
MSNKFEDIDWESIRTYYTNIGKQYSARYSSLRDFLHSQDYREIFRNVSLLFRSYIEKIIEDSFVEELNRRKVEKYF